MQAYGWSDEVLHDRSISGDDSCLNVFEVDRPESDSASGLTRVHTVRGCPFSCRRTASAARAFHLVIQIGGEEILIFTEAPSALLGSKCSPWTDYGVGIGGRRHRRRWWELPRRFG